MRPNKHKVYLGLSVGLTVLSFVIFMVLVNVTRGEIRSTLALITERAQSKERGLSQYFNYSSKELLLEDGPINATWNNVVFTTRPGEKDNAQIQIPSGWDATDTAGEDLRIHNQSAESEEDLLVNSISPGCPRGVDPERLPSHEAYASIMTKRKGYGVNSWVIDDYDVQRIRSPHSTGMLIVYKSATGSKVYHYCLFEIDHDHYVDFSAGHELDKTEEAILASYRASVD